MKTDYLQSALLAWRKGTAMPDAPAGLYVGLINGDPTGSGAGGTEVTTTVRTAGRVAVTFGDVSSSPTAADTIANDAIIDFGAAAAAATFTHFGIYDAATDGNMLDYGAFSATQNVAAGVNVLFQIGALTISES